MAVQRISGFHQAVSVARGPLRFSYAPAFDESRNEDGTRILRAREGFGVALRSDAQIEVEETEDSILLHTRGRRVPNWGMRRDSCDQPPIAVSEQGEEIDITLTPYAKTPVRLSLFPLV